MRRTRGFTLAEVMVAMLFVSIAMFGYISLHMRIIHSSITLQKRQSIRRKVDLHSGLTAAQLAVNPKSQADGTTPLFPLQAIKEMITPYLVNTDDLPGAQYDGKLTFSTPVEPQGLRHWVLSVDWSNRYGPQQYVTDSYVRAKDPGW